MVTIETNDNEIQRRRDRAERFARALAAIRERPGRDIEGKTDVAVRHDAYLADIYEEDLQKR